ncbi:MAG: hypothetical protein IJC33_05640 [Clostridia bacterium]|nr:hypothetical protein [Clostridia bacterium]
MTVCRLIALCLVLAALAVSATACGGAPDDFTPLASQLGTTTTTPSTPPEGCTGAGDCPVHYVEYHNVPGGLISYVGMSRFDDWLLAHRGGELAIGDFTVVDFVQDMEIDKATFMLCLGITEATWNDYLPNTAIPDSIIARNYVEAIYGGDQAKIDAVFLRK